MDSEELSLYCARCKHWKEDKFGNIRCLCPGECPVLYTENGNGNYIQSRSRKAAEEIMDKVFIPGETVNTERLEKLIARHFAEGEE